MQSGGDVARREPGDHHRRRGKYGVDGGTVGVPILVVVEAGLTGAVWWALRRGRRGTAGLAGLASLAVAGIGAGDLYFSGGDVNTAREVCDHLRAANLSVNVQPVPVEGFTGYIKAGGLPGLTLG
jgi:hypothetical protein